MVQNEVNEPQSGVETSNLEAGETHEAHGHTPEGNSANHDQGLVEHHNVPAMHPDLKREVEVEVDAETVSKSFKGVVRRYQKQARIPGFRAGKVPESLIRSKFAKEVRQEVLEELIADKFQQEIAKQALAPVSQPQVVDMQLQDGQPLRFKAAFEVQPQFEIDGYDSVPVTRPEIALTDDEFEAELGRVLEAHAVIEPVEEDRELVEGDWAEIGFSGIVSAAAAAAGDEAVQAEDVTGEPITGDDVLIEIGGKNTLPAFNEALRGSKRGQELGFEVDYPADFGEPRLAGKTVKYDVTVKAIKRKVFPERDEEFARQLGNYESFDEFESKLREHTAERKREGLENGARDRMIEEITQRFDFPVPEAFVQQQVDARLDRGLRALAQQGMTREQMQNLDFVRLRAAQREKAIEEVKASMILDRISEAEGISVSDEDLDRELLMLSIQSREPLEALRLRLEKDGGLDRIREQMRREKTGSILYEKLAS